MYDFWLSFVFFQAVNTSDQVASEKQCSGLDKTSFLTGFAKAARVFHVSFYVLIG